MGGEIMSSCQQSCTLVIDDVIYGPIRLTSDVLAIVETPQFKRLKNIKQLGFLKLVSAKEDQDNRYYHCLGTYHAACRMLDALEKNTTWLADNNNKIPVLYRRAVEIAALLHDIGHGPFSHAWETAVENYQHEQIGFACIDAIFAAIDENLFPELRANDNYGIKLIKALIEGKLKKLSTYQLDLPTKYQFIFYIVSNEISKLDVDKWDYLKRDHYYIKELCNPVMDFDDVFLQAKVSECGQYIEYRYEDYDKIYNLLAARWYFHKNAYQLPRHLICDQILKIIIDETQRHINGHKLKDINAEHSMASFLLLIDRIVLNVISDHPLQKFLHADMKFQEIEDDIIQHQEECFCAILHVPSIESSMRMKNTDFH